MSWRRPWIGVAAVMVAVGLTIGIAVVVTGHAKSPAASCRVRVGGRTYALAVDQATNATTIAAVAKRLGLPDHAVTVALTAALQESRLHNLTHGDRDSLGLFQQRPSQGWGTPAKLLTPTYASRAFLQHLVAIEGWQSLPVGDAAQMVQRSAAPLAYAAWEPRARALAVAMTGEAPAALTCQFSASSSPTTSSTPQAVLASELGGPPLGAAVSRPHGWTAATWLVAHARALGVTSVTFDGRRWTPASGSWELDPPVSSRVRIGRAGGA